MKKNLVSIVGMLCLGAGCAEERAPINRVQANALDKSFFVGQDLKRIDDDPEFYLRGTLIDVGYGAAQNGLFTSTYAQPVSRIRWEITETHLNARLAYERIPGTDGKGEKFDGLQKKTSNDGQMVASYKILSQFDIKRAYNPTTGEAQNIVEENTTDRPWYDRQYLRVDWSKNEFTSAYDFDTLSLLGLSGGIEYEPLAFYVADPSDENAPHFETANGYFDVTTKAFAKPGMVDLSALGIAGKFPACMLPAEFSGGSQPYGNCNPVEITIRQSFRKVVDSDYEPVNHDGLRFQAFGAFNFTYRHGYERNYGMVDDRWYRFAARYNLWERSHYYQDPAKMTGPVACATQETTVKPTGTAKSDPNRDTDKNGTADECEAVTVATGMGGSQCDLFRNRCTLPYASRQQRTIPWYINGSTDEDLFEATDWAVQEWNVGMLSAVQVSRLVECRRSKGSNCNGRFPMWTGQQDDYDDAVGMYRELLVCQRSKGWNAGECTTLVDRLTTQMGTERGDSATPSAIAQVIKQPPVIVLCHNPVRASDHPACGKAGLAPRLGDLRYHTVQNVPNPQTPSPWGIMVDGDDPVTGEKVAASINIWTSVTDAGAQSLLDLVRYMNGELKTEDITNGQNVSDWVKASKLSGGMGLGTMTKQDRQQRLAAAAGMTAADFAARTSQKPSPAALQTIAQARRQVLDVAARADVPSRRLMEAATRMSYARGTATETALINPAMLQLAGLGSDTLSGGSSLQAATSPLGLNHPKIRAQLRQMRENGLAKRGACVLDEASEPSGLTGIADIMKVKFPMAKSETEVQRSDRWKAMFRYLRRRYHYAVLSHEMGHSIGLRHNFASSAGALHYRPQYWQLRTKNGTVLEPCDEATDDPATCVGPRFFDSVTPEEQSQLIWMFGQASAMDYPGDVSQDMMGLGMWDFGAARLFYGDAVAVYADEDMKAGTPIGIGVTNVTDTFGGLLGIRYSIADNRGQLTNLHYTHLQSQWKVIRNCYSVTPQAPSFWQEAKDGVWDPVLDGHIVSVDGKPTKCRQRPVDYVAWSDLRQPTSAEIGQGYYSGGPSVDAQRRLRVPYHFATDTWADLGNLSVFRHDAGADAYEQAMFLLTTQENRHILDNFRRNRTTFNVRDAADKSFSRYNEKLVGLASGISFLTTVYQNFLLSSGASFGTLWPDIVNSEMPEQMLAASMVFDHLTRQLSRPEDGEHYFRSTTYNDPVLHSAANPDGITGATVVILPNGTTGYLRDIGFGGHPLENAHSNHQGDFNVEYQSNAGSYYDKINSIIHMSISEDRFVSQNRGDFYDARFRANGMADIFPEGYRRVIANALTGDRALLAAYLAADASGRVLLRTDVDPLDAKSTQYPARPLGWTSWWPTTGPTICFASNGRNVCSYDQVPGLSFGADTPAMAVPVDPQIGWEVQKFIIANVLAHIPANQQSKWIDMLKLYRLGQESAPAFDERIEWQDPVSGQVYSARTYGKECLFGVGAACTGGRMVQKGIAARVLEYANELTGKAYKLDKLSCPATTGFPAGFTKFGRACVVRQPDGTPVIISDPAIAADSLGSPLPTCDLAMEPTCTPLTVNDNHFAFELAKYKSVPDFLWQALIDFRHAQPHELGLF